MTLHYAQSEVTKWNEVPGWDHPTTPSLIGYVEDALAMDLVSEEYEEVIEAWDRLELVLEPDQAPTTEDQALADFASELADLIVVTLRAASAYGIDLDPIFRIIMDANWTKFVENEDGTYSALRREDGKILKGPNYDKERKNALLLEEIKRQKGVSDTNGNE